jgi:L-lysine 6-transaminase
MCAFDCKTPEKRDELQKRIYSNDVIVIGCGSNTIRFRPPLIISDEEIDKALSIIDGTLKSFN